MQLIVGEAIREREKMRNFGADNEPLLLSPEMAELLRDSVFASRKYFYLRFLDFIILGKRGRANVLFKSGEITLRKRKAPKRRNFAMSYPEWKRRDGERDNRME